MKTELFALKKSMQIILVCSSVFCYFVLIHLSKYNNIILFQNPNKHIPLHNTTGLLLRIFCFRRRQLARCYKALFHRFGCTLVLTDATRSDDFTELVEKSEIFDTGIVVRCGADGYGFGYYVLLHVARLT